MAPKSFTGEDLIEIACHGSPFIVRKILDILDASGARAALPGEFSFRAIRNGKLKLSQAEGIQELITAQNEIQVKLAQQQMSGAQHSHFEALSSELKRLAIFSELSIDFSDQEVDEVSIARLKSDLSKCIIQLEKLRDSFDRASKLRNGIGLSLVGLPNAGKSSLFNALLDEDRSIVTDVAGTTRDVVRETLQLDDPKGSYLFRFMDTAGFRETTDKVEAIGVDRLWDAVRRSDILIFTVDSSAGFRSEDEEIYRRLQSENPAAQVIGVLTKCDQIDLARKEELYQNLNHRFSFPWIFVSSTAGTGLAGLKQELVQISETRFGMAEEEILLTRKNQVWSVERTIVELRRAYEVQELDLFASDIRHALVAFSPLMGEFGTEEILTEIFSNFCIGK